MSVNYRLSLCEQFLRVFLFFLLFQEADEKHLKSLLKTDTENLEKLDKMMKDKNFRGKNWKGTLNKCIIQQWQERILTWFFFENTLDLF